MTKEYDRLGIVDQAPEPRTLWRGLVIWAPTCGEFTFVFNTLESKRVSHARITLKFVNMERYRSGHNGLDSKSSSRGNRHVGSNPTLSAKFHFKCLRNCNLLKGR